MKYALAPTRLASVAGHLHGAYLQMNACAPIHSHRACPWQVHHMRNEMVMLIVAALILVEAQQIAPLTMGAMPPKPTSTSQIACRARKLQSSATPCCTTGISVLGSCVQPSSPLCLGLLTAASPLIGLHLPALHMSHISHSVTFSLSMLITPTCPPMP